LVRRDKPVTGRHFSPFWSTITASGEADATTADANGARFPGMPQGCALLRIQQKIFSTQGKIVIYVLALYRSDRHTGLIRRFR